MGTENIISLIAGIVGTGFLSSYFTIRWQRRNADLARLQEFKETRYKCIILLLYTLVNFEKEFSKLQKHRPDIQNRADLEDELRSEYINAYLYASDSFIHSLHTFITKPNQENLRTTALSIRKDLWGIKTHIGLADL